MNGTHDRSANEPAAPAGTPAVAPAPAAHAPSYAPPVAQVPARDPRAKSVGLATVLSIVPGLGQIYVGYYQRGFVHAIVVGSLISFLGSSNDFNPLIPLFALLLGFFWLYNIIDGGRRAALYNLALAGGEDIDMPKDFGSFGLRGSVGGGLTLIGIGFVLLLHTRFDVSLDWLEDWWPVLPMLLGAWLLFKAIAERGTASAE